MIGLTAARDARIAQLEGQLSKANEIIERQSVMIAEMKREGFMHQPEPDVPPKPEDSLPEPVVDAIAKRARPGSAAWNRQAEEAARLVGIVPDEEIVDRVLHGEEVGWV